MPYPVISVAAEAIIGDEQLGSKSKFWFSRDGRNWLFKEGRENTGEDWAEKIAAEIARSIHVDAAQVELAESSGRPGSASKSFVESGENLIHGNEILAGMILGYDHKKRLHQSDHTLANIIAAVQKLTGTEQIYNDVLCTLASYLVLDALICNTDRHHENWGFLVHFEQLKPGSVSMLKVAPSFDHASSLGRELLDERRSKLLQSKNMETYVRKGHGGIYLRSSDGRGANPLHLVEYGARQFPQYFRNALEHVAAVTPDRVVAVINDVPPDRMSDVSKDFAYDLMCYTHQVLTGLLP